MEKKTHYWTLMPSPSLVWVNPLIFSGDDGWWIDSLSSSEVVWMPETLWQAAFIRVRLQWPRVVRCREKNNVRVTLWVWVAFFLSMPSPGHTTCFSTHRPFELMKVHKVWRKKLRKVKAFFLPLFSENEMMCIKDINTYFIIWQKINI